MSDDRNVNGEWQGLTDDEVTATLDDLSDLSDHERQLVATFVNGLRLGRGGLPPYRGK